VHHDRRKYDGYRLTYMGYDFLAIKAMLNRGSLTALGRKIGIGKESDIYLACNEEGTQMALKIHRLGRTSFTNVRNLRDYVGNRKGGSWLYLSRLAAIKEHAFMQVLYKNDFPVPVPVDNSRHCVLMSLVEGYPLTQVGKFAHPQKVYNDCVNILLRLARCGLIHGDFNEFNFIISEKEEVTLIDFPQMVSTNHENARMYFERDAKGLWNFFNKKLGYSDCELVKYEDIGNERETNLDDEVEASGFSQEHKKEMEKIMKDVEIVDEDAADVIVDYDGNTANNLDNVSETMKGFNVNDNNDDSAKKESVSSFLDLASSELRNNNGEDETNSANDNNKQEANADDEVFKRAHKKRMEADEKIKERVRAAIVKKKKKGHSKKLGSRNRIKHGNKRKLRQTIKESRS
jgi:RIO kinase 2